MDTARARTFVRRPDALQRFTARQRRHHTRALTQCLRRLEASGFVKRSVVCTAPVAVMYEISPLGRSLEPHLRALLQWVDENRDAIKASQCAFATQGPGDALNQTPGAVSR